MGRRSSHGRTPGAPPPFWTEQEVSPGWAAMFGDACPQFNGKACPDGSVIGTRAGAAERVGLGVACTDDDGTFLFGRYGMCHDRFPSSLRTELWSVLMALQHGSLPLTLVTGNLQAVSAYARGEDYCVDGRRPAAELWRGIWARLKQMGGPDGVRAHLGQRPRQARRH